MKKDEIKIFVSCILITLFFLLHSFATHRELIDIADVLFSFFVCLIGIGGAYLLLSLIKIERWRIFAIILFFAFPFFFFSAFHEWLVKISNSGFLSRYIFLLPSLGILFVIGIWKILKVKYFPFKLFSYVNLTLMVLCVAELFNLTTINISSRDDVNRSDELKEVVVKDSSLRRNIYFLVFDEYPSSASLKNRFSFHNNLDSVLEKKGFNVFSNSISNYNFTPFSIASTLNMSYLKGFSPDSVTYQDYSKVRNEIYNNKLTSFFNSQGYSIINLSIFDIKHSTEGLSSDLFSSGANIVWQLTLPGHIFQDVGWILYSPQTPFRKLFINQLYESKRNNRIISDKINTLEVDKGDPPFFLYAHFVMPHPPYFFDSSGAERPVDKIINERIYNIDNSSDFLSYLGYTNSIIDQLSSEILKKEKGEAIIIIMGDHGYRTKATNTEYFQNFNAVFLPNFTEQKLPFDSISNVNEFRLIFNAAFGAKIPFLKDSTFILSDFKRSR